MYVKNKFIGSCLVFLSGLTFISCHKDVAAGTLIQANGFVIDSVKNKRLSNATIYLYGAHQTFYGIYYDIGPMDSTVSDNNGNFSLKYIAAGNSIDYALAVGSVIYGGFSSQNNYVVDVAHTQYPFNYSHQLNNAIVRARELNYLRLNLKLLSNPYDTMNVMVNTTYGEFGALYKLTGNSVDTSILTRCLPDALNYIFYEIEPEVVQDSFKFRREIDTVTANLADTLTISKTFNSTYDILLQPF
jgi:hypothetical protein